MSEKKTGLALMREPFPARLIGKLPKPTKAQTDDVKKDYKLGIRCNICGGWHHPKVVHLDYIGHAALTDRLLDADPNWYWEPLAFKDGLPLFDQHGGLWIKLTVTGTTRLGYGNAENSDIKDIGSREKEVIGDALRNAAMRFGAGLELWHKGDLHKEKPAEDVAKEAAEVIASPGLGEYVIKFGKKLAGQKLKEVDLNELESYLNYLREGSEKNKKPLAGDALELFQAGNAYLKSL